jgi:hypothetical protein
MACGIRYLACTEWHRPNQEVRRDRDNRNDERIEAILLHGAICFTVDRRKMSQGRRSTRKGRNVFAMHLAPES